MAAAQWMPFYIGDYLRDTSRLTTEQHGAYLLLIMDYWVNGPLPDDDAQLAAISRIAKYEKWSANRPILAKFFRISRGFWRHKRIDQELRKRKVIHEVHSKAGSQGAAKRWQTHSKTDGQANGKTMAYARVPQPQGSEATQGLEYISNSEPSPPHARAREAGKEVSKINGTDPLGRSAPLAPPALRAKRKELLRQKLFRFCDAHFDGDKRRSAIRGLCGTDPEHDEQWWLDTIDKQMRKAHWDDTQAQKRTA